MCLEYVVRHAFVFTKLCFAQEETCVPEAKRTPLYVQALKQIVVVAWILPLALAVSRASGQEVIFPMLVSSVVSNPRKCHSHLNLLMHTNRTS